MVWTPQQILFGWSNPEEWDGLGMWYYEDKAKNVQCLCRESWGKESICKT